MPENNAKLQELKAKRETFRTRLFFLMVEIAFIFAVPAIIAALLGPYLDQQYASGSKLTIGCLIVAFALSWVLVVVRYRRAARDLKEVSQAIELIESADE